jgi:tripartite-type tricarboxylate transporter receptor subunit TctC
MNSRRSFIAQAAALVVACATLTAQAQTYPTKQPIKLIIPFVPGGSNDTVGRYIADELSKRLGQTVVVDNRGGAGGTIGTQIVAKSAPDGYTLLLVSTPHTANTTLYKKLPYRPDKDFVPVARIATAPVVICVSPNLPVNSLKELIDYAKARPGQLNYASAGVGSGTHLAAALFAIEAGVKLTHVPYKGAAPAMTDVAGGYAQISVGTLLQALPYVKSGRMKALAVSGTTRQAAALDVPTSAQAGLPRYEADNWWGVVAPAGTPADIVATLNKTIGEILATPQAKQKFEKESAAVAYAPGPEFGKFLSKETTKWAAIIKELGIENE